MSGKRPTVICWDTNIFLSLLGNEKRTPEEVSGINEQKQRIDAGELHLVTSVITLTEVLESKHSPQVRTEFERLFRKKNVDLYEVNGKVARIAHDIRDYYRQQDAQDRTLSTPDAIHLATAVFADDCNTFYTFDKNNRSKTLGLLSLDNPIAGKYSVSVQKPHAKPDLTLDSVLD